MQASRAGLLGSCLGDHQRCSSAFLFAAKLSACPSATLPLLQLCPSATLPARCGGGWTGSWTLFGPRCRSSSGWSCRLVLKPSSWQLASWHAYSRLACSMFAALSLGLLGSLHARRGLTIHAIAVPHRRMVCTCLIPWPRTTKCWLGRASQQKPQVSACHALPLFGCHTGGCPCACLRMSSTA